MDRIAPRPQSPFAELFLAAQTAAPDDAAAVTVGSLPFAGCVSVRGRIEDTSFLGAVRGMLGLELPVSAGEVVEHENYRALWLGPDFWLVLCGDQEGPVVADKLRLAFNGIVAAALDVSGAHTRLRLSGEAAPDLLATGCLLDLDPATFGAGRSVQTTLGNVVAVIHCLDLQPPTYDLYLPRSKAMSFWRWLENAGREFGLRFVVA